MGRIVVAGAALVMALAVGFGVGWLVFDDDDRDGERSDADVVCEQAEDLPTRYLEEIPLRDTLRTNAIALLAQAAGVRNDDLSDLDALGQAGSGLQEAIQTFDEDRYADARQDLIDACADR